MDFVWNWWVLLEIFRIDVNLLSSFFPWKLALEMVMSRLTLKGLPSFIWHSTTLESLICCRLNDQEINLYYQFSSFQSPSCVWLFVTPWTAARQASLPITNSLSLLKLMSIELVMPFNHLILYHLLLLPPSIFPSIRVFLNESALCIRCESIGVSASVLPMNIQDWFPLGWTCWICLTFKGLSRVFSNTTVQKHQFFSAQLSL